MKNKNVQMLVFGALFSAIAFVLFAVILVFSVLQLRITRTKEAEKHA